MVRQRLPLSGLLSTMLPGFVGLDESQGPLAIGRGSG